MYKLRIAYLLPVLLLMGMLMGWTNGKTQETRTVYLSILSADTLQQPMILVCSSAYAVSIQNGITGDVVTRFNSKINEDLDKKIGTATVIKIENDLVAFTATPNSIGQNRGIKPGDLIKLDMIDTLFKPLSLTGQILTLQLQIADQFKDPYFAEIELAEKYAANPEAADKWLLDTIYNDLINFYDGYKDNLTAETFTKPFPKGRYQGKNVRQMFEALKREDIENYLWFMISFPGKYIGTQYKFNEIFVTWLINDAPIGGMELVKYFEETGQDSVAFAKKIKSIPGMLSDKSLSSNIATCANNNAYWNKANSEKQLQAAIWYSQLSGDKSGAGLAYLFIAENAQNREEYEVGLKYCRLSEQIYSAPPNYDRMLDLNFKQSFIYYTTSRFDSSFIMLEKIRKMLQTPGITIEDYTLAGAKGKYHDYVAYTYYKSGRYLEAQPHLDSSLALKEGAEDKKSLVSNAYSYNLKGDIYKSQSLYDKAFDAYQKSGEFYTMAGEIKNAGIKKIDMAIVLFRQGKNKESNQMLYNNLPVFENTNDLNNLGLSFSQIGQNYWNLGKYDSAIAMHTKAINYRRQSGNRSGQAFSWEQLGTLYQKAGFKSKALEAIDSAATLYEILGNKTELAEILVEAGKVYKNDKENEKAEQYYRRAANTLADLGNKSSYADALNELGLLLMNDKPEIAIQYLDSSRILSLATGKQSDAAYAMMNMGAIEKGRGKIQEGKQWYLKAREILSSLDEPHALGHYYRALAADATFELNLDSANRSYQRAIAIFDSTDKALSLSLRMYVAGNYQNMGNYQLAEQKIDEVMEMARAAGLQLELAESYSSKAWMLIEQGKLTEGQQLVDSASKYYRESGNTNSLAYISDLMGELNRRSFNFTEAYKWYSVSDSIYAQTNNAWLRSARMFNFVVLYYYQGDYQKSLDYTYKAIELRPFFLEDKTYIDLQVALAEIYYYLGKTDSTKWFTDKYLPIAKTKKLQSTENLISLLKARMLVDEKKFSEAIPYLLAPTTKEAMELSKNVYQQALATLGRAYSGVNKRDSAQKYFQLAARIANTFELPSFSWEALYFAGLDAYQQEAFAQAIPLFKQAVELVNKQATNLYGGEEAGKLFKQQPAKADLYFKLMSALTKTGQKEEAWQYANLSQSAAISDLSGGLSVESANPEKQKALQEAQTKFQQMQNVTQALQNSKLDSLGKAGQIAVLEAKKEIAKTDYLNYISGLKKEFPELSTFFANQVNPENLRNLHRSLPDDMAMMMYVVNDKELMIFWATKANTGIVTGTIPNNFFATTDAWNIALKNPLRPAGAGPLVLRTKIGKVAKATKPTIDVKTGAEQLYSLLIEPLGEEVKGKRKWCIIPNGKLTHLPFHALGKTNKTGTFEYVAATKTIFYTNQPNEMFLPWEHRDKKSFAAFGNPDKTLASAGVEVNEIAKVYQAATVYTEDGATLERASKSLSDMDYVHFATHGVLSYPDFDSSYLVMAPNGSDKSGGKLTLYDIRSLDIKGCDLVTLSACETAVSAEIGKGWYISPANAFLINRVRSVIASLWEVDDVSTSLLMQQFYIHLQTMPKAEALRQAMADVSAKPEFEHPFYWAAFVLYGDWQ
jgi:tetratricopeptide (TPR) repeat protein